MFSPTSYLEWAKKFYGKVPYDLASSGIPPVAWKDLGLPLPEIDDPSAIQDLPSSIARYNDVSPAEVAPALGTSHAVFLAYAATLSPGDELLIEHPHYEPLIRAAEGLGVEVRTFDRRAEEGFRIVPERVAAAMTPRTRGIVVTNLHNPSGVRASSEAIRELSAIAEEHGAYVIVDEVYSPFDDLPEDAVFRRSARKLGQNVIAVGSLTKCYGLGMHRIGWVLGPEEIIVRCTRATVATIGHLPLSHAAYGVAAFGAMGELSRRAKRLLHGKREVAQSWAASLPDAQWSAPCDGLFGLVTLPGRGDLRPRIEARAHEAGVLVCAGSFFGAPESFRLSWATCDRQRFEQGLALLSPLAR